MPPRSPRERLHRLFHRRDVSGTHDESPSTPPPVSPSSAGPRGQVRKTSSRTSLRDMLSSNKGRSEPKTESKPPTRVSSPEPSAPTRSVGTPVDANPGVRPAAATAMHPLPSVPHQSDLSADLQHLTADASGQQQFGGELVDRTRDKRRSRVVDPRTLNPALSNGANVAAGNAQSFVPGAQRHSKEAADLDIVQNDKPKGKGVQDVLSPLTVQKQRTPALRAESPVPSVSSATPSLSHKHHVDNLRQSSDAARAPGTTVHNATLLGESAAATNGDGTITPHGAEVHSALGVERGYLVKDAKAPVDLGGIVDLRNTEDATLHEKWAPAVTHETIIQNVHEIREERITREIHNHHVFHRILPIVDIEVLPARHFVPVDGGYAEISEDEVPGRTGINAQWIIAETMSKLLPSSKGPIVPQHFTARRFDGNDGDYKEYVTPEGFTRTETTWIHPPTIEDGGWRTGQTYPFYIGSPNPADDGLRARLPGGGVIGVSPLLARQQSERLRMEQGGASMDVAGGAPPPPPHKTLPAAVVAGSRAGAAMNHA